MPSQSIRYFSTAAYRAQVFRVFRQAPALAPFTPIPPELMKLIDDAFQSFEAVDRQSYDARLNGETWISIFLHLRHAGFFLEAADTAVCRPRGFAHIEPRKPGRPMGRTGSPGSLLRCFSRCSSAALPQHRNFAGCRSQHVFRSGAAGHGRRHRIAPQSAMHTSLACHPTLQTSELRRRLHPAVRYWTAMDLDRFSSRQLHPYEPRVPNYFDRE